MPGRNRTEAELKPTSGPDGAHRRRRTATVLDETQPATVAEALTRLEGSIEAKVNMLVQRATLDALAQLPTHHNIEAEHKIINAIEARFRPHIEENEIIAAQIDTIEYENYVKMIQGFMQTQVGDTVCADGRIASVSLIAPRVGHIHRRLAGIPDVRYDTVGDERVPVIDDPMITAAIQTAIEQKKAQGIEKPEIVEFIGGHINSGDPIEGCGAQKGALTKRGRPAKTAMEYGGLEEYYKNLGDGKEAYNNVINKFGGRGTTYDMVHDIHSQGLIFGIGNLYDSQSGKIFDRSKNLRDNLVDLHNEKKIIMTELLAQELREEIMAEAASQGFTDILNIREPHKLAENVMMIGRVAKAITERHEAQGFTWMPDSLKKSNYENYDNSNPVRTLAYRAVRNSVYQLLCGIVPGEHDLTEHPEQLIRVGPVGASFNVNNISFIEATPEKAELRPQDIEGTKALYNLFEGVAGKLPPPHTPIDLTKEARIILVTEKDDPNSNLTSAILEDDMARLRDEFREGVNAGEAVIIGMTHEPGSRKITHVVSRPRPYANV